MTEPSVRFRRDDGSEYPSWSIVSVGEVVEKQAIPVNVHPDKYYREIGIRSHGKGLFHKEPVQGIELGNKRVFEIVPNCLVVNIVFAWERAVSKTTADEIGMIASHRFPMYKPKEGVLDLDYIVRYLITDKGKQLLELASPGGAGRNRTLGQKEFANSKLSLPCYEEQKKIAKLLVDLDEVISVTEDEVTNLETQKKAIVRKLFSQEVRFTKKNGDAFPDWEECRIRDCLSYEQPGKYIVHSDSYDDSFDTPVLTANKGFILGYTNESDGHYTKGDVIIYDDFTMDMKYVSFEFKVKSSAIKMLTSKTDDINLYFMYGLLQSKALHQETHTRSYISIVEPMLIEIPCSEEQYLIASFLSDFDESISAAKRELELWRELKAGLLQQMFV